MATIRSKALCRGVKATSGETFVYTVPAATTTIVKSICVTNLGAGTVVYEMLARDPAVPVACELDGVTSGAPLAVGGFRSVQGWWCLNAGDQLDFYLPSGGNCGFWVSGVELS